MTLEILTSKTLTSKLAIFVLGLCLATARHASAAGAPSINASLITWDAVPGYQMTLTVSGAGQDYRYGFAPGEPASFSLFDTSSSESGGQSLADGNYSWQLSVAPVLSKGEVAVLDEAREAGIDLSGQAVSGYSDSGHFTIAGGFFVQQNAVEQADKDEVFTTDLIVEGSACVGIDCAANENFGFDTLRLKENNLRIKFEDTSSSPHFPGNDWQLAANDTTAGGANKFSIDDLTGGRTPFTVEAGAPNNALFVDSEGRIGVKTATPLWDLHAVSGNSPTLRLEQDGSNGFEPQTWDLGGNEAYLFIRDVTNSSRLPFRLKPGAPTDSLFIAASGHVGVGTDDPDSQLTVSGQVGTNKLQVQDESTIEMTRDLIKVKNNGTARISMEDTSADGEEWQFAVNGAANAFVITNQGSGMTEFTLSRGESAEGPGGDLTIGGNLYTGSGTCVGGCDAVFRNEVESIEDHAAFMWEKSYLRGVGPTVPEGIWNLTEKTGGILNELEKAHIYIEQLNIGLKQRDMEIERLKQQFDSSMSELRAELDQLQALIVGE